MSVNYTRINFKNRVVQRPRTYTKTENQDGSATLTPSPGTVEEAGTPLSAANMNKLDKGVYDCAEELNAQGERLAQCEEDCADMEKRMVVVRRFTATIPTTGWTSYDDGAYFTLTLALSGILASDTPDIGIVQTGAWATDEAIRQAWSDITRISAAANALQITAQDVPEAAIPIQVRCIRHG